MNEYEITYILRPSLEDDAVEARSNAVAEIVRGQGGAVVSIERLGKKRLAYEIGDVREGSYVAMQFTGSAEAAKELERQLRLHEDVVRELLVRLDKRALAQMAAAKAAPVRPAEVGPEENTEGT
ncbi:MAG: 30S ribosomal protein S6 [Candidatus Tyrphobacter sp.]